MPGISALPICSRCVSLTADAQDTEEFVAVDDYRELIASLHGNQA